MGGWDEAEGRESWIARARSVNKGSISGVLFGDDGDGDIENRVWVSCSVASILIRRSMARFRYALG